MIVRFLSRREFKKKKYLKEDEKEIHATPYITSFTLTFDFLSLRKFDEDMLAIFYGILCRKLLAILKYALSTCYIRYILKPFCSNWLCI